MRLTHIYENIALLAFSLFLVGEVVAISYVTFTLYVKANGWLLYVGGLLRGPPRQPTTGGENVTRFADTGNASATAGLRFFVEYPHDYRFVVDEPAACRERKPFVVVMVPVNPRNRADRDVIRTTWGAETRVGTGASGKTLSLFFMLGLPTTKTTTATPGEQDDADDTEQVQRRVLEESAEHRDLLQADFLDSYSNLTIKTMVMMEWLDARCRGHAAYAMKVDTDVFLNVRNLVDMLSKAPSAPESGYMTGLVSRRSPPERDPGSKWYLPRDVYPGSHYPPYALGGAYVLSLDLPGRLVEASRHVRAVYMEDVYLGLCMERLGVPLTDPPRRSLFPRATTYSRCAYSRVVRAVIPPEQLSPTVRMQVWEDFKRPGPPGPYCY